MTDFIPVVIFFQAIIADKKKKDEELESKFRCLKYNVVQFDLLR